jgi:RNA polymerase sigma-70 factor (ECF subfamily)
VNEDPDAECVERVLAGDPAAFDGIVRRWQDRLFTLAFRLCRDHGRAEDMTQEAFVKVFRSLGQWRRKSAFSTWMTSVALNAYRSHLRLRPWIAQSLDEERAAPPDAPADPGENPLAQRVRRVVSALPGRYRDALTAFYFAEKSLEQAAAILRIAPGTLKARLHRGRALVQRALTPPSDAGG